MGEGSCAETRVGGVGRLLHQARRVAGQGRAAGQGGVPARAEGRRGMAACLHGAWRARRYGCSARRGGGQPVAVVSLPGAGQRGGCERAGGGLLSWKWLVDRRDGRGGVVVHLLLCGEQAGLGGSEPLEPGAYCQVVEPTWPGVWPAE
jgi:hypothetical protein